MKRSAGVLAASAIAAALLFVGCGSTGSTPTRFHPLRPPRPPHAQPPRRARPTVGDTQRVRTIGTTVSVTVRAIIDPLRGSGIALLPHTRAIGVRATIRDEGPGVYDSSSTGDFSIVPSSGAARPVFAPGGSCQTPLRDWDNAISPGQVRAGCIAYELPAGAHVVSVRFSPHAAPRGRATWLASR